MGKQLKQSVKVFHSLMLYRRLPVRQQGGCSQEPFLRAVLHPLHPPMSHTAHRVALNPPGGWEGLLGGWDGGMRSAGDGRAADRDGSGDFRLTACMALVLG